MNEQTYLEQIRQIQKANWPKGAVTEPVYPIGEKPLSEYLTHWATVNPNKAALNFYGKEFTFAQLDDLSNRFANLLRSLDVQPGDGVALFTPNSPQFHIAYFGIMKAGAIHIPCSPLSKEMELKHQLGDSNPKVAVCFDALLPVMLPVAEAIGIKQVIASSYSELTPEEPTSVLPEFFSLDKVELPGNVMDFFPALESASAERLDYTPGLDDIAALNYTSGTTGLPKGVIHTHRNIIGTVASFYPLCFGEVPETGSDQVILNYLPEFWIAGENSSLLFPMYSGATLVLMARWDAKAFMQLTERHKVNQCIMLVDSIDEVLNHPEKDNYDMTSLGDSCCISFIKKLNKNYRQRWQELTGATVFETAYGMTETHTCDTFTKGFQENDLDLNIEPAFLGMTVPGTEMKICDFATGEIQPLGSEGEIWLRTPTMMKGYWCKPDLNERLFEEGGWYRTGDLGMITEQGFFRFLGRRKEMLKVNGMSVFPAEIESMLGQHPAVGACAVVGQCDAKKGQIPIAFVVLKPGEFETEESLYEWCKQSMAIFKVPQIRIRQQLPMTPTGKVRKVELEKEL
ncbi:AMP-binding protein [Vibrio sp.]|uniref:AMP-binding protein n=1 Tax=Vibrio sp. TaxID=678 RepID=UPI003D0A3577